MLTRRPTRLRAGMTLSLVVALFAMPLEAHDFWLVPLGFQVDAGADLARLELLDEAVAIDRQ
ncbi:MAG: hypothetical protein ABR551_09165, partial [Gemmatimonadales bacterium]